MASEMPMVASVIFLACLGTITWGVQAQPGQLPTIDILSRPGCDVGTAVVPNMQECVLDEVMGSRGTLVFTFNVGPKPKHSILFTLRSVGGKAEMHLSNSRVANYDSHAIYFNDAVTESLIRVPADQVIAGQYTLVVQGRGGTTEKLLLYLRLQTPGSGIRLAAEDKAALESMLEQCCPASPQDDQTPNYCNIMPGFLSATTAENDLCNFGEFLCDEKGHLQKADFSGAGFNCQNGFPDVFGQLPSIETLMLRFNNFYGDTLDNVAAVLAGNVNLRRLMIGSANLTGTVPCALFEEHELRTIMMSNNKLEGAVPACVFESPYLEELYLSMTPLSGPLPDSFNPNSKLRVWYSVNADPDTGELFGPGFTGEIPSSISNAAALQYVELSNHKLTGGVPMLPPNIVMFEVQNNTLDGSIASPLPSSLVYLNVMNNSLTGPIPDFSQSPQLAYINLRQNQITGTIPASFGAAAQSLKYMDMSRNLLEGNINDGSTWEELPQMQVLLLQENNLEGFVPASLAASTSLMALHLANNRLTGNLTAFAAAITPGPTQSPQMAGGRRLQAINPRYHSNSATLMTRVLLGGSENRASPSLGDALWKLENVVALANNEVGWARRRLQQDSAGPTAAAGDTPTGAVDATSSTASEEPEVVAEAPAPGGATTTTMADPSDQLPQEPTPEGPTSFGEGPTAQGSEIPQLSPAAEAQAREAQVQNDIGPMAIPTQSSLQGNSLLYLNLSNNALTGGIPAGLSNLEMFRDPSNSTDPFDMYVFNRGGLDRTLDLTYNLLYGEFPEFLMQLQDLQYGCSCSTTFSVSDGNFLYCPTKASMEGVDINKQELNLIKRSGFMCLAPKEGDDQAVPLADYLSKPQNWLTSIPAASEVVTEKTITARQGTSSNAAVGASRGIAGPSPSGPLGPGAIAGIVIGVIAGLVILASLAYFVGYKRFYQVHRATSFKRGALPDAPGLPASGPYPDAAYGTQPVATPGFDIETPTPAAAPR